MNTIVTAGIHEIPVIRELAHRTWVNTYVPIIGVEQVNYMLELFYAEKTLVSEMARDYAFIIGHSSASPAGFASWSLILPSVYKLHKLYVLPEYQGNGLGSEMLRHISDSIKAKLGNTLTLNVNRYNEKAIRFYKKMGFTSICKEDVDIGNGFFMNDHVMSINL